MSFKKEVILRLEKIDQNLVINNHILDEHQKRSTQLEARVVPLEQSHIFVNKLAKVLVGLATLGAGLVSILHFFR